MNIRIAKYLDHLITYLIALVIVVTPVIVFPLLTDPIQTPKSLFLASTTLVLIILKLLHLVLSGRINLAWGQLELPLLALIASFSIFTLTSSSPTTSLIGELPLTHGSLISWINYLLFYLILINHIRIGNQFKIILISLLSASVLSSLLYLVGLFFPASNLYSTTSFSPLLAVLTLPIFIALLIRSANSTVKSLSSWGVSILLACLILSQQKLLILPVLLGFYLLTITYPLLHKSKLRLSGTLVAPLIVTITLLGLLYLPTLTLPKNDPDSTLPFNQSLQILKSALSDSFFKSSGVLPFKINYDLFRPLEMNKTNDWNKSFEHPFNEIMGIIINLKVLGIAALGWLLLKLLKISLQEIDGQYEITRSISVSCLIGITLLFIYPGSTQFMVTLLSLFALKIILLRPRYRLIFSPLTIYLSLIILLPVTVMAGYLLVSITLANYHYNQGLKNLNDLQSSYSSLETANKIYPYSDIYHSNLAIISFALGTKLVQETPGLSPEAQQEVTNLLQNSLKSAEKAVQLNPKSKDNWLVLASIYQRIGRSNPQASQLADAAYNQALTQNPTNPSLLFKIAESYFTFGKFPQAAGFFEQAITLKADYANAYYNLSLTYKELGRVEDASKSIDTALNLLDPTSIDYQAAKNFKAELVTQ